MRKIFTLLAVMFVASFSFAQTHTVTFNVNVQPAIDSGLFNPAVDTNAIFLAGNIWGWAEPGSDTTLQCTDVDGDKVYTFTCDTVKDGEIQFKFFIIYSGAATWNNGEWAGDPNRTHTISSDTTLNFNWGVNGLAAATKEISNLNITVYPNPASDYVKVNTNNGSAQLFDLSGKVLVNQDLATSNVINTNDLSAGVYIIKIENAEGVYTQKLIVK